MTSYGGRARALFGNGWVPLALVLVAFVGITHRAAAVDCRDAVVFLGYLAGWIVLPGTAVWRLVDPRRERRPLGEDLAVGALVGYVLEFPVYLTCLALGHPHGYLLWPLVPLVALCLPATRRIRHLGAGRMPAWWSWSAGAAGVYLVVWFGRFVWSAAPYEQDALSRPYIDEPYHLALATGLKHFFPPRVTYVEDTPLDYHWASHLHIAAASWVTGIEPALLLRTLAIPALIMIAVMAAAFVAVRLTGAPWVGPALLLTLVLSPANYIGWAERTAGGLLSLRLYNSPSAGFVNAALLLGVLLCIELLRKPGRHWGAYCLVLLTFTAMSGGKSTSLPTLIAGLMLATLVTSVLRRKVAWPAAGLTVLAVVGFQLSRWIFFGPGSRGLGVDPLAITEFWGLVYPGMLDPGGGMPFGTRVIAAVYVLSYLTLGAATFALLARKGWQRAEHVFLAGVCAAGIGAGFTFHQSSFGEGYFIYVVMLPLMLAATLGVHHLVEGRPGRLAASTGLTALAAGALGALVFVSLLQPAQPGTESGSSTSQTIHLVAIPLLVTMLVTLALSAAVILGRRLHGGRAPGFGLLIVVVVFAGFGAGPFLHTTAPSLVEHPLPKPVTPTRITQLIGPGGIGAARWLRAHAPVDALVATNAHCTLPRANVCTPRNFWMAGYAERQFLVEGWSYVSRATLGLHAPKDEDVNRPPFWDPKRLAANDSAFDHPTAKAVETLRDRYGVGWLLVDMRYPVDLPALAARADLRYSVGVYRVLELR